MNHPQHGDTETGDLIVTRIFKAPQAAVFKAWSAAERQAEWMGPAGFTAPAVEIDFRVDGRYRTCIRSPAGQDYRWQGTYKEIREPERIVFTVDSFGWDDNPNSTAAAKTLITVTLTPRGRDTLMAFRQSPFPDIDDKAGHVRGWQEAFDKLGACLERAHGISRSD